MKNATREDGWRGRAKAGSARKCSLRRGPLVEYELVVGDRNLDRIVLMQVSAQDLFGKRIFQVTLDRTAHRARAINWVVTLLDEEILRFFVELDLDILSLQSIHDLPHFEIQDQDQVRLVQGAEDNDIIQAVQELRPESLLGVVENPVAHLLITRFFRGRGESDRTLFPHGLGAHIGGEKR